MRKLVATLACRNAGSRLFGKPLQRLDVANGITILEHIVSVLEKMPCIDEVVLAISEGQENDVFVQCAEKLKLRYVRGDERDVLKRLIEAAEFVGATDVFRVTSESPFLFYEAVLDAWELHTKHGNDATFLDDVVDGCGFEIIDLHALTRSHSEGTERHRSEMCTLFIRENPQVFQIEKYEPLEELIRKDLRLTVDNPEDLVVCRRVYAHFTSENMPFELHKIIEFLDAKPNLKALIAPYCEEGYQTMYK
jgi:spore coat polysaccharide biosynthesis protein SpsF